jgi:hypothetical protein
VNGIHCAVGERFGVKPCGCFCVFFEPKADRVLGDVHSSSPIRYRLFSSVRDDGTEKAPHAKGAAPPQGEDLMTSWQCHGSVQSPLSPLASKRAPIRLA